jgi:hypothetical protein
MYYHTVGIFVKPKRKIVETKAESILLTHIHERSLSWLGVKSEGVKVVLWGQTLRFNKMMRP